MSGCCTGCNPVDPQRTVQLRRVLWVVLGLNLALFATELSIGWWAQSSGLQADALDSLADALVYAVTLGVVTAGMRAQAGAALLKGAVQGCWAPGCVAALWRAPAGAEPIAPWMAGTAVGALLVNVACFGLLRCSEDGNESCAGSAPRPVVSPHAARGVTSTTCAPCWRHARKLVGFAARNARHTRPSTSIARSAPSPAAAVSRPASPRPARLHRLVANKSSSSARSKAPAAWRGSSLCPGTSLGIEAGYSPTRDVAGLLTLDSTPWFSLSTRR